MRKLLTLPLLALLAFVAWLAWALLAPVTPAGQTFVLLRPGFTTRRIAAELKSAGLIHSDTAFVIWHSFHRRPSLKAGEYLFERSANSIAVHHRIARGDIYVHTVVVPEGYTIFDIARAIQDAGLGPAEDFLRIASTDTALIADLAPQARSLEGYLFPSTYQFTRTQGMPEIVAEMVKQFRLVAQQIGLTSDVHRSVTVASIIEKETAVAEERPLVASVYYNRLSRNIALQADPSVIYAELLNGTYQGALYHADLQTRSPYNTYLHPGLPPGPIGNPGKSSLEAALHPGQTDYSYFVSDGNGHHRFARSLEEHNRNVAALRRAIRGR